MRPIQSRNRSSTERALAKCAPSCCAKASPPSCRGHLAEATSEARQRNLRVVTIDIVHGVDHDVTRPAVEGRLLKLLRSGRVKRCMLGTPCTLFSLARNRTRVIRTPKYLWGLLDRKHCSVKDLQNLKLGNKVGSVLRICVLSAQNVANRQE